MIYAVRHLTAYRYAAQVAAARCNLRLRPADGDGQTLLSSRIEVHPAPSTSVERADYFGIRTTSLTIDAPHRELQIEARSRVQVDRPAPVRDSASWEHVRERALASRALAGRSPVHFMYPSRRVPIVAAVTDYARASFTPGRAAAAAAFELMERVRADFVFDSKATTVSTPLAQAFAKKRGVCQDFAHVMIAGLRGLGLPAAYVSGYLRTTPPPGRPRLRGADASHAWVSVWCGEGWLGLDPTNGVAAGNGHIVLATGRDYTDVAPVDGIILVSGSQTLHVEVDVVPEGAEEEIGAACALSA